MNVYNVLITNPVIYCNLQNAEVILFSKQKLQHMTHYKNSTGRSGVSAFIITTDSILVRFKDGGLYEYTYLSAGSSNVEHMKALAVQGSGLNSFINRFVKSKYNRKLAA